MLSEAQVKQVRELLTQQKRKISYREIALIVGMSRASVSLIASGKRPDYSDEPREMMIDGESIPLFNPDSEPERCCGCGGMVHKPCLLCVAQRRMTVNRTRRKKPSPLSRRQNTQW